MKESVRLKFAERIRELRQKHGYTQQELAELADLDYKHIQRLESKKPTDVKLETIEKLAKAFKISRSLLDGRPIKQNPAAKFYKGNIST
jgi:transcriptional regulator with XRE-family HTH domain